MLNKYLFMQTKYIITFFLFFFLCFHSIYALSGVGFNDNFHTNCPSPIITSYSPVSAPVNTELTILGSNFTNTASVQFNTVDADFTIISDTEIKATVPDTADSTSTIRIVSSGNCIGSANTNFTLINSDCVIGDIYISEVYDARFGSSGMIELYNPTNSTIFFNNDYVLERFGDIGNATPSNTGVLMESIGPMQTFLVKIGNPTACGLTEDFSFGSGINANDEIKLLKNGVIIDVLQVTLGTDNVTGRGYTIIRNPDAVAPKANFDVSDWQVNGTERCDDLDTHTADANTATPSFTQSPSQSVCEGETAMFSVFPDSGTYTYQWKTLDASGNWVNLVDNDSFLGTNTNNLLIGNINSSLNNTQYYCEFSSTTSPNCTLISDTVQLNVTIAPIDTLSDQVECTEFVLPTLTNGNYFTETNGAGTQLNAGDSITTTQTIFIYNEVGTAPDTCSNESSFTVTITGNPPVDTLSDQTECTEFVLLTLTNGNYFTETNGAGTQLNAGDSITTTQTIFIYNEIGTAPNTCSNESSFSVTITGNPPVDTLSDQTECTEFILPTLTNGNYFTETNSAGTQLNAGDTITTTQTIFIYNEIGTAPNTCSNESSFSVTITGNPPIDTLSDQTECTEFVLPPLTDGNYFTETNGAGTQLNTGDSITADQTIFIYNEVGTAPDTCSNESSFSVTITGNPPVDTLSDQTECTEFVLPTLTNGNYFTETNSAGTQLNAGDTITTTQTIFIYNEVGTTPDTCSNESSFSVTITGNPPVDTLNDQTECTEFVLPTLTNGNYFTETNGAGTQLNAGDSITADQTIFIYNEVGTTPDTCSNESSFSVTILPAVDFSLTESNITIDNQSITVNMTDTSITYEYAVDNAPFQTNNVFNNLSDGLHTLYVRDINNCLERSITFTITVDKFEIPPFFTPNGDMVNDTWLVCDNQNRITSIYIYNRYGKLLRTLPGSLGIGWDGNYNGNPLPSSDYWYVITLNTNEELTGHFALKR